MSKQKSYIAVDLGAESGRVMLGTISDKKLKLQEMHRFETGATSRGDSIRWDVERIFGEIKTGIAAAAKTAGETAVSISFDSWGVDFGLIGKDGKLLEEPFHYRDERNLGMIDEAAKILSRREIYENTGIQFLQFNTLFQLLSLKKNRPEILEKTDKIIMMADLFAYMLCGRAFSEYTLASTGQLVDMRTGQWSRKLLDAFGLNADMLPEIVKPGTVVGKLTPEAAKELGCGELAVVACGSHDTASAVAAVPADKDTNWAYLSSGTWSLLGLEVDEPIINDETFSEQFTNEGGVYGTIRLLKNIMGLWLIQESRRYWLENGTEYSYPELEEMAEQTEPFLGVVDTQYHEFMMPGDMPAKINRCLDRLGYECTDDPAKISRIIVDSLAVAYRKCLERLEALTGKKTDVLHIVGGGTKHLLLCQCAANILGCKVAAGPVEATASGNILVQAIASGQVESLDQAREIVANSFEVKIYEPKDTEKWNEFYKSVSF
jgi:rhamnulokinase